MRVPADVDALDGTLTQLVAAEDAAKAKGTGPAAGVTAKALRAAETRMHEAVGRIAGAGILAFARNATVRAAFEAIKPKKK